MNIFIYAPFYDEKSYGVRCMYTLCDILSESGINTKVLCFTSEDVKQIIPEKFKQYIIPITCIKKEINEDDLVIYPDIVDGNPLNVKRHIRWLLNKPYALDNNANVTVDEYMFAYSKQISEKLQNIFLLCDDIDILERVLNNSKKNNNQACIYFGKCNFKNINNINKALEKALSEYDSIKLISRQYPINRYETLKTIAESDVMISLDSFTNLNYEATLVNTVVYVPDNYNNVLFENFPLKLNGLIYNFEDKEKAYKTIGQNIVEYKDYLEKQRKNVPIDFNDVLNNYSLFENNNSYKESIIHRNKEILSEFKLSNKKPKDSIVSVNYLNQLPNSTKLLILSNYRKIDKESMTFILKPKWYCDIDGLNPKDLNVMQLLLLLIRRFFKFGK